MRVTPAPPFSELLGGLTDARMGVVFAASRSSIPEEYVHWDRLRHLDPPPGLTPEEWWFRIKWSRQDQQRELPLTTAEGRPFTYTLPDDALRGLHLVDQRCGGEVAMGEIVTGGKQARRTYLVNAVMEEAIRSSQLEGATTSRRVAKELLRSGRAPKDRSERMVRNTYEALVYVREHMGSELRPRDVLELQRILTTGTLDDPAAAGRLQRPEDHRVAVYDRLDGSLLHAPPPAEQLPGRLEAMCRFANAGDDAEGTFVHPVVRAIVLHFWLAYDHPFDDGNGRTARVLFYWLLRSRGYWLAEYLSISRILREAPGQYSRSFLLTETDEGDLTYFLLAQLKVISQAIDELQAYLARRVTEVRAVERSLRDAQGLNHRQAAVLSDAVRNDDRSYTLQGHATSHGVTLETARADLNDLADRGLLLRTREARRFVYTAAPALADRRGSNAKSK